MDSYVDENIQPVGIGEGGQSIIKANECVDQDVLECD